MTKAEFIKRYGEEKWLERLAYRRNYHKEHKEELLEKRKVYRQIHKEEIKEYRQNNKDKSKQYDRKYRGSQKGRAKDLIHSYKQKDQQFNRGETTITKSWLLEHIFKSKCIYCGDSDWQHLGADRIDNEKAHTPDNVVCACGICNIERQVKNMSVSEFIEYRKNNPRECDKETRKVISSIHPYKYL